MVNLILILIVGGLIGWIASIVMRTNAQQGIFLNVVVGIVGALLGGFLLSPLLGTDNITVATQSARPARQRLSKTFVEIGQDGRMRHIRRKTPDCGTL